MTNGGGRAKQGRIRARRAAVQALYQWQLAASPPEAILKEFIAERELVKVDMDYFTQLTREVPHNYEQLVSDLEPFLDREWRRLEYVERAVMLIGAYELRLRPEVPYRVVINEAIELCKMFGTVEGHTYVNGVLDRLARQQRPSELQ
ncbi:MAG: transcription antitermination factor NusB [Pseudomonadota bacterium]